MSKYIKFLALGVIIALLAGGSAFAAISNPVRSAVRSDGQRLYISGGTRVYNIDVTDPASPTLASTLSFGFGMPTVYDILTFQYQESEYLFVTAYDVTNGGKIYVYDITTGSPEPTSYSARVSLPSGVACRGIAVDTYTPPFVGGSTSGKVYVAATNGNVYQYTATNEADFLDDSSYSLTNTYNTGAAGLYGITMKEIVQFPLTRKHILYVGNRSLGQIMSIEASSGTVNNFCTDADGVTFLTLSDDDSQLYARVLQSDADIRVFNATEYTEITDMAIDLGGSGSVHADCNYEGMYFENNALYFSKYNAADDEEQLYRYTVLDETWSDIASYDAWAWEPGACDSIAVSSCDTGYAIWRANSELSSYALITVDDGTVPPEPPIVIDDYEGELDYHVSIGDPAELTYAKVSGASYDGSTAMEVFYSGGDQPLGGPPHLSGTYQNAETVDLSNHSTLRFYYQGDGSSNTFQIELNEEDGENWTTTSSYSLTSTDWTSIEVAFADLEDDDELSGNAAITTITGYRIKYDGTAIPAGNHYFDNFEGITGEGGAGVETGEKNFVIVYMDEDRNENWISVPYNSPQSGTTSINTLGDLADSICDMLYAAGELQIADILTISKYDNENQVPLGIIRFSVDGAETWDHWTEEDEAAPVTIGGMYNVSISNPGRPTFTETWTISGEIPEAGEVTFPFHYYTEDQSKNWMSLPSEENLTTQEELMDSICDTIDAALETEIADIVTVSWYDNDNQVSAGNIRFTPLADGNWDVWTDETGEISLGDPFKVSISNPGRTETEITWPE